MVKRQWIKALATASVALVMAGCGGGGGSGASAPTVVASVGDGQATISWSTTSGIYYWLWEAEVAGGFDLNNPPNAPTGGSVGIMTPYVAGTLINGLPYSFYVNAHTTINSPGGPQSNLAQITPRLAGTTANAWKACSGPACPTITPPGALYGVTFGDNGTLQGPYGETIHAYLAVGTRGVMYATLDPTTWANPLTQPLPASVTAACIPSSGDLRATDYAVNTFVAVGDNGTVCFSGPDASDGYGLINLTAPNNSIGAYYWNPTAAPWNPAVFYAAVGSATATTTYPTTNFYAVESNQGGSQRVAVGSSPTTNASPTIIYSADGQNWYPSVVAPSTSITNTSVTLPTNINLNAVTYGANCGANINGQSWGWVAVGSSGTILATTDPSGYTAWVAVGDSANNTSTLRGVACTPNSTPSTVPSQGPNTTIPLWVAVGDSGVLLTSLNGTTWAKPTTTLKMIIGGTTYSSSTSPAVTGFTDNVHGNINMHSLIYVVADPMTIGTTGSQFVATGDYGTIFTSVDGVTWTLQPSGTTGALYAVAPTAGKSIPNGLYGVVPYGYEAVGAGGATTFGQ
jgi:hypothetical protein